MVALINVGSEIVVVHCFYECTYSNGTQIFITKVFAAYHEIGSLFEEHKKTSIQALQFACASTYFDSYSSL